MKNRILLFLIAIFILIIVGMLVSHLLIKPSVSRSPQTLWNVQSIDAMKYSRDTARENISNPNYDKQIDIQMTDIAATGATHVGIGTPYDPEFVPYLTRWVQSARRHGLKIWFRGNFSGWEGWFEYPKITRTEHLEKLASFISTNPGLFEDGDILSPCPECENGGPGDPRRTGDIDGFRQFLIDETEVANAEFKKIHKSVAANYHSMNGDVAKIVMDRPTTQKLGGIIVVDHYVSTPEQLAASIKEFARTSGGKVVLGEFGAPIPDLNGEMSEAEQAQWLDEALSQLVREEDLVGLNYWVNKGGSTALWNDTGFARKAVTTVTNYYHPAVISLNIVDQYGAAMAATAMIDGRIYQTNSLGVLSIPFLAGEDATIVSVDQQTSTIKVSSSINNTTIVFNRKYRSVIDHIKKYFSKDQ